MLRLGRSLQELRRHFQHRPDTEHQQALVRIAVAVIAIPYTLAYHAMTPADDALLGNFSLLEWVCITFAIASLVLLWAIYQFPSASPARRVAGSVLDMSTLSFGVYVLEESAMPLLCLYIWVMIGNGIRYGRHYLWLAAAFALSGFVVATAMTAFWSQHPALWVVTFLAIAGLTLYMDSLIRLALKERRAAELANDSKTRFIANVSHEVRTAVASMTGMLDILADTKIDEEQREFIGAVQSSARTLNALIGEILDLAKIESGKVVLEQVGVNLHALVEDLSGMIRPLAEKKGIGFVVHCPPDLPPVISDPLRIQQILLNLLSNAVKFTEHGQVELDVTVLPQLEHKVTVQFDVMDTGVGMSPESKRKVFHAFAQADPSIARRYGGTGLGMTITQQLCQLLGGEIGVESEEGKGSHFWVKLPLQRSEAESVSVPALVLCHDIPLLHQLESKLQEWGYAVYPARGIHQVFAEAMARLRATPGIPHGWVIVHAPALALPPLEFARALRSDDGLSHLRIVVLGSDQAESDEFRHAGITAVIPDARDMTALFDVMRRPKVQAIIAPNLVHLSEQRLRKAEKESPLAILIAEDHPTLRQVLDRVLIRAGHRVVLAQDGEQASEELARGEFDVAILDIHMPEFTGIEVAQQHQFYRNPRTKLMALTADAASRERCLAAGFDAFLTKPVDPTKLLRMLQAITHRPAEPGNAPEMAEPAMAPLPILDRNVLKQLDRHTGSRVLVAEMVRGFEQEAGALVTAILQASQHRQLERLRESVHTLQGYALSMGAVALGHACGKLLEAQAMGPNGQFGNPREDIEVVFEKTRAALHEYSGTQ